MRHDVPATSLARRLKLACEAANLTPSALSLKMDPRPGRGWVRFVITGRIKSPRVTTLERAARAANVSIEWLLFGSGEGPTRKARAAKKEAA